MTERPTKLSRAISNTWKKIASNLKARWLAPRWVAQSEKSEALIRARTLQFRRATPVTVRPDILFIHVPKAAGTSMFTLLSEHIGMTKYTRFAKLAGTPDHKLAQAKSISFGHLTADSLIELKVLSRLQLESAFTFGFVRNPFERAVSLFAYLRRQRAIPSLWSFDTFLKAIERERPEAGLWNVIGLSQAAPMVQWMRPRLWHGPTLTLKFENLEGALKALSAHLPIPPQLPHLNPSRRAPQPVAVSPSGLDFIREFYAEDFTAFDYSLDLPEGLFAKKK